MIVHRLDGHVRIMADEHITQPIARVARIGTIHSHRMLARREQARDSFLQQPARTEQCLWWLESWRGNATEAKPERRMAAM
jgi:hypothetical protein